MEKKRWNQNYLDKYDDIMKQLYHVIGDILREKLGEEVIINYQGGQVMNGKLRYVYDTGFVISLGQDDVTLNYRFDHMASFPFYEGNNINMITDIGDEW